MKRNLPLLLIFMLVCSTLWSQQRYLNEVFTTCQKINDSVYAKNYQFLPTPAMTNLKCDIYLPPAGDTAQKRPLIIMLHTGSFLPIYYNHNPTGDKSDSATVEMCKRFAMRGYVVCAPAYRQGWNPTSTSLDVRRGTIMQAVYRGMQDAKAAVRYMRKNAALYKVDTTKVVMGGQGTGGYIAIGCAYIDRNAETRYSKFIDGGTNQPYIDTAAFGDIDGVLPATYNYVNNPGYSSKINMIFNLGGAIGDLNWMEAGELPVVGFHSYTDPFAPDTFGMVKVPGLNLDVINVDGSHNVCQKANTLGIHNMWKASHFNDVYTTASLKNNENIEGYFRFKIAPGGPQAAPWEWWDSTTCVNVGTYVLTTYFGMTPAAAAAQALACHVGGLQTNQMMSKAKALAYIDTMQNYLAPRIMVALQLKGYNQFYWNPGINKTSGDIQFSVYPNPAHNLINVQSESAIRSIVVTDLSGREVMIRENNNTNEVSFSRDGISNGVYFVKVITAEGNAIQKLILE